MKRWYLFVPALLVLGLAVHWLFNGWTLNQSQAAAWPKHPGDRYRVVLEEPTWYGKAVIAEDLETDTFAVVQLRRYLGLFWANGGGGYGSQLKNGPMETQGYYAVNKRNQDEFAVSVKVDPRIHFIAIGSESADPEHPSISPGLTLQKSLSMPETYKIAEVKNGYALLVADRFTKANFTFHAFDFDGNLIAHELYGSDAQWVE